MINFDDEDQPVDSIVDHFEDSWATSQKAPDIDSFLPDDADIRRKVLPELVASDLELRIKSGHAARVEEYLKRFPELRESPEQIASLIEAEYRVRARREPGLQLSEFSRRFPDVQLDWSRIMQPEGAATKVTQEFSVGALPSVSISSNGRFRLIRQHDEGGLGKVWEAHDDELDRQVAVKEIKQRFATDYQSRTRFINEARITSRLEHPGIVPVYGLGEHKDGRPFYAMRFVHGRSLQQAIEEQHQKSWREHPPGAQSIERRRLINGFVDVCNTIHYAHQQGVLHRDIKPANIMLGSYGETLVVDWGLAKVVGQELTSENGSPSADTRSHCESGGSTKAGRAIGSPSYMSPEQAAGRHSELNAASDVYSLGATLYTMLTNQPPVAGDTTDSILDQVRATPWKWPREQRRNTPAPLVAICERAMSFQPKDRYQSALALANEVERYLADESVVAYRESLGERFVRVVRRNSKAATVAATSLALLTGMSLFFGAAMNRQKQKAELSQQRSDATYSLLEHALAPRLEGLSGRDLRISDVLQNANADRDELLKDPVVAGRYHLTLANSKIDLGLGREAIENASRAVAEFERSGEEENKRRLEATVVLVTGYHLASNYEDAIQLANQAIEESTRELGEFHKITSALQNQLAACFVEKGELEKARAILTDALAKREQRFGPEHELTADALHNLAGFQRKAQNYPHAIETAERAIEVRSKLFGPDDVSTISSRLQLGVTLTDAEEFERSASIIEDVREKIHALRGNMHPEFFEATGALGVCYNRWGKQIESRERVEKALELLTAATKGRKDIYGEKDPRTLVSINGYARALEENGRFDEALDLQKSVLADRRQVLGDDHPDTAESVNNLAVCLAKLERYEEALPYFESSYQRWQSDKVGFGGPKLVAATSNLAECNRYLRRYKEALKYYEEAMDYRLQMGSEKSPYLINKMAMCHSQLGNGELAGKFGAELIDFIYPDKSKFDVDRFILEANLASYYLADHLNEQALAVLEPVWARSPELLSFRSDNLRESFITEIEQHYSLIALMTAVAYRDTQRCEASIDVCREWSEAELADRFQISALTALAEAHLYCGDPKSAIEPLSKAGKLLAKHLKYGICGVPGTAYSSLASVQSQDPANNQNYIRALRGVIYAERGKPEAAATDLQSGFDGIVNGEVLGWSQKRRAVFIGERLIGVYELLGKRQTAGQIRQTIDGIK